MASPAVRSKPKIPKSALLDGTRTKLLDSAGRLDDLVVPAGNRLELLKGDQSGRHSIRVNAQYRVTFRWENGHAYEVGVEDYH